MKLKLPGMLGLTALLFVPAAAQQDDADRRPVPTLTVNGTGEIRVAPDVATVRLGVTRQAPTAQAAQEQVNQVAQAILTAITRLGIKREDIQTSQLTLYPVYAPQNPRQPQEQEPRIVAYRASNVVSVRVERLGQVGPVIDAALKAGANQLEGVFFSLKDDLPARERALRQAVQEARRKAMTLAEAANVRLDGILQLEEGGVSVRPLVMQERAAFAMAGRGGADTPVSPGEITVNASVTIRYRITEGRR